MGNKDAGNNSGKVVWILIFEALNARIDDTEIISFSCEPPKVVES